MGSVVSSEKVPFSSPSSVPQTQLNLFVTKEVTERWHKLAQKELELQDKQKEKEPEKIQISSLLSIKQEGHDVDFGGGGDSSSNQETDADNVSLEIVNSQKELSDDKSFLDATIVGEERIELKKESLPSAVSESQEATIATSALPNVKTADVGVKQSNEKAPKENMERLTKLPSLTGSTKLKPVDLESGGGSSGGSSEAEATGGGVSVVIDNQDQDYSRLTTSSREDSPSVSAKNPSYQLPEYEELFSMKQTSPSLNKDLEETQIQIENAGMIQQETELEEPFPLKEVPIPKAVLPVVIDQDDTGNPTIQTIRAWKMKEDLEKELERNDELWTEQMRRLTTKLEDSTMEYANDVERRVEALEANHPEIVSPTTNDENSMICNILTTRIGKCYEKNKNELLKCNEIIREFAQCTSKSIKDKFMNF